MSESVYWLGFHLIPGVGSARLAGLLNYFGDIETAWAANRDDLLAAGLNAPAADSVLEHRSRISLDHEMAKLERSGAHIVTLADDRYPRLLREVSSPPNVLYVRGNLIPEDETAIGIVGTRRVTSYGKEMTRRITAGLARAGVTIVSGLARGVDGIAHDNAIESGGRTIAVLGSAVDQIYPPEHRKLAEQIMDAGATVSEFPLGTRPEARNFPIRNRLISGLSLGIVVVEAPVRSGALITAEFAADQSRTVYAVPGSALSASSEGTIQLLRNGASIAAVPEDVLDDLNLTQRQMSFETRQMLPSANDDEREILAKLDGQPKHIDEIALEVGATISQLSALLLQMQLKGIVRDTGGQQYVRDMA